MSNRNALPVTLSTERLVLTAPSAAHVQAIALLANNRAVHQMMARLPFPYTDEDARFFVEQIAPSEADHCFSVMLEGSAFIGVVGLHFVDDLAPELGYWLGEPYWGNGYATEAATAVVAAAQASGFPELRSRALTHNRQSRNVLRKLGFVEIGEGVERANNLAGQRMVQMRLSSAAEQTR